ncbi:MAG: hypothetical protein CMF74_12130 [Maricaulis sp.]|jgi:hypothetical protein|nr:hypothetical protein [Maricaulis sp.]HAQ34539.1 hypothetical protein [Alphaproteobacteria bacterium]
MAPSRIRLIEIIVAASVVVISVASLFVAVFQGIVMQRTLEASVLPVLQYSTGNYDNDRDEWVLVLNITNTGIGPAELRSIRVTWDGQPIEDAPPFLMACCLPASIAEADRPAYLQDLFESGELNIIFDGVDGRFFAPQESVDFISVDRPDRETQARGRALWSALDRARHDLEVELCYCSVFDDCWQANFPTQTRERVRQCPAPDEG